MFFIEGWKVGMKTKKIIVITSAMLILMIVSTLIYLDKKENVKKDKWEVKATSQETNAVEQTEKTEDIFYKEGNEDMSYNYIVNISFLESYELPLEFYENIGEICNQLLQASNITGKEIKVEDVNKKYNDVSIIFGTDEGTKINMTYDLLTGKHNEYLTLQ